MKSTDIQIKFRSGLPIYAQIVAQVQQLVLGGALRPGDQLPPVRRLADELRVNFNTVARAYRLLDEAGLISTQHGRGTFILDLPGEEARQKLQRQALDALTQRYLGEARRLGSSPSQVSAAMQRWLISWQNGELSGEIEEEMFGTESED